jgi:hypothetical protein
MTTSGPCGKSCRARWLEQRGPDGIDGTVVSAVLAGHNSESFLILNPGQIEEDVIHLAYLA